MKTLYSRLQHIDLLRLLSGKWLVLYFCIAFHSQFFAQAGLKNRPKADGTPVSFNVFPNPNAGKFTVVIKEIEDSYDINVYNLIGEMVYHWESNGTSPANVEINLSKQPKGVYLVELDTERANLIKKVLVDYEKGG